MNLGKFIPTLCMLLGLTGWSNAVDPNCNYFQNIKSDKVYYVFNPGNPDYYTGEHTCRWRATSESRMRLNCTYFNMPPSVNCSMDRMSVTIGEGITQRYCGFTSFHVDSLSTEMTIDFHSSYDTYGGIFMCELKTIGSPCRCGLKNPSRIVGGTETGINEFPMMAGIVDLTNRIIACGATIIGSKYVVTAAHCVEQFVNNTSGIGVIVGEHDVTTGGETNATKLLRVESVIIHPEYANRSNDIAVVEVQTVIEFNMLVGPACLPFYYSQEDFTNRVITATGWGLLEFAGKKSNVLMKAELKVISQEQCDIYHNVTSSQLCTYEPGKDTCQFDSGGPLMWSTPSTNKLMLLGVVSYGFTCADETPGVNTRVTSHLNFIRSATPGSDYSQVY